MDLSGFGNWLWGLFVGVLGAIFSLLGDVVIFLFEGVLAVVAAGLSLLPSPSFVSESNALGNLLNGLPPFALFIVGQLHIPDAFAVVGAGVAFNLTRKLVTLGQW